MWACRYISSTWECRGARSLNKYHPWCAFFVFSVDHFNMVRYSALCMVPFGNLTYFGESPFEWVNHLIISGPVLSLAPIQVSRGQSVRLRSPCWIMNGWTLPNRQPRGSTYVHYKYTSYTYIYVHIYIYTYLYYPCIYNIYIYIIYIYIHVCVYQVRTGRVRSGHVMSCDMMGCNMM